MRVQISILSALRVMALLSAFLVVGCVNARNFVRDVPVDETNYAPRPDKALVVFMHPSRFAEGAMSSVYEIADDEPVFLGIVPGITKSAHYVEPGKTRFMVIGESADFMDAELASGMVYYALVRPRIGIAGPRFSFRPIHLGELRSEEFAEWYQKTPWVENLAAASEWAEKNKANNRKKMTDYLQRWLEKSEKPMLGLIDGLETPYQLPE